MQSVDPVAVLAPLHSSVLIVADDGAFARGLQRALRSSCALVENAQSFEQADALRERCVFDLIVLDISRWNQAGIDWLARTHGTGRHAPSVVISDHTNARLVLDSMRAGAQDFMEKSADSKALVEALMRHLPARRRATSPAPPPTTTDPHVEALVGRSTAIQEIRKTIIRLAPRPAMVLIQGETGTGKELVARTLHDLSGRKGEFVPVNCSAISSEIIESELFGHVRGAFTSAFNAREGLFHYARDGTLFLDEVSEMPWEMQSKLLRALEERTVRPVGAEREVEIDTRIICASNRDIAKLVVEGKFRRDLFYRINVVTIHIPPLRDRKEDLLDLVPYLSKSTAEEMNIQPVDFSAEEFKELQSHLWPGNVRELRNVIERALLLGKLPADAWSDADPEPEASWPSHLTLAALEKRHILKVLDDAEGNKSEAARRLDISRKTLERKLKAWKNHADGQPR